MIWYVLGLVLTAAIGFGIGWVASADPAELYDDPYPPDDSYYYDADRTR